MRIIGFTEYELNFLLELFDAVIIDDKMKFTDEYKEECKFIKTQILERLE